MRAFKVLILSILAASLTACGVAGPKGEKGDKGDQGIPGETGPQGPVGQDGSDGHDGIDGENGQDGKDGVDGLPGTDGATWLTGEEDPDNSKGKNGDLYLNVLTFDIFLKTNDIWSKIGNIKGKDGQNGLDGSNGKDGEDGIDGENGQDGKDGVDGLPGTDGATWLTGEEDPDNSKGKNGDLYLNTSTNDIFTRTDGEWVKIGNIKGDSGENGHDADTYGRVHTVTFDAGEGELIEFENSIQVSYGETIELPLAERDSYIFTGWYTGFGVNDGKFTNATPVTRDVTLYAGWEEDIKFSIYFNTNGGSSIATQSYSALSTIISLPEPIKTDYTFSGWYLDESLTERFKTPYIISKDIDVYAKWEIAHYTVTFETNGGDPIEPLSFTAGDLINGLPSASKEYKVFSGWYLDNGFVTLFENGYEIHSNITVYAKYNDTYCTISFNSNGGSIVAPMQVIKGDSINTLPSPKKTSYTFNGWYKESTFINKISYPYKVVNDMELFAKWTFVDPYPTYTKISSFSQLKDITDMSKKYVLISDINCDGEELPQLGVLTGEFNGDGHKIYNYNNTASPSLFNANSGTITNLELNGKYTFTSNDVGPFALANNVDGTISKCKFSGEIIASCTNSNKSIGGIVSKNYGIIQNCLSNGTIRLSRANSTYSFNCGAIAGTNYKIVENCVNASSMISDTTIKSGFYGISHQSTSAKTYYTNCVSLTASDSTFDRPITFIVSSSEETITNCYYFGEAYSHLSSSSLSKQGSSITKNTVNSASFYYSTLGLSSSIWNASSLNCDSGYYIDLIMNHLYVL